MKLTKLFSTLVLIATVLLITASSYSQLFQPELKLKPSAQNGPSLSSENSGPASGEMKLLQKPKKKIYFVPGGKIGMFFLQGDFKGHQMISLEVFGKYVAEGFWAEISIPFRFKTSPAFTDIGVDVNVMWPFLGAKNKSEVDPFVGGGLGLHFIGMDKEEGGTVAARGGLGLNLIGGAVFFKNYDFNVLLELKYFYYLREFDEKTYQGIGLNVGVTFP
jgi:hypothetical protein